MDVDWDLVGELFSFGGFPAEGDGVVASGDLECGATHVNLGDYERAQLGEEQVEGSSFDVGGHFDEIRVGWDLGAAVTNRTIEAEMGLVPARGIDHDAVAAIDDSSHS